MRASRARDLAVGEEVLELLRAAEAGGAHAIPGAPAAHLDLRAQGVEVQRPVRGCDALDMAARERGAAGDRERGGLRGGRRVAVLEAQPAVLGDRPQAAAEVQRSGA